MSFEDFTKEEQGGLQAHESDAVELHDDALHDIAGGASPRWGKDGPDYGIRCPKCNSKAFGERLHPYGLPKYICLDCGKEWG